MRFVEIFVKVDPFSVKEFEHVNDSLIVTVSVIAKVWVRTKEWEKVENGNKFVIMLDSVNLFENVFKNVNESENVSVSIERYSPIGDPLDTFIGSNASSWYVPSVITVSAKTLEKTSDPKFGDDSS